MGYVVEWRHVFNDVRVTEWKLFHECGEYCTPLSAYEELCKILGCIVNVSGFVESPDWGHIRTSRRDFTLFEHPDDQDCQYRIVENVDQNWLYYAKLAASQPRIDTEEDIRQIVL